MKKQLEDVVHVAVVNILTSGSESSKTFVERDLMLAKVSTEGEVLSAGILYSCSLLQIVAADSRAQVVELANLFEGKVIDVRPHQVKLYSPISCVTAPHYVWCRCWYS